MKAPVYFSSEQIRCFRETSGDENPLHWDESHARSSPFGKIVVHGMATVLVGIGRWAQGRRFRLRAIEGTFHRPLFPDVPYDLEIVEEGNSVTCRYLEGALMRTQVRFEWDAPGAEDGPVEFAGYRCAGPAKEFGQLAPAQLPSWQWNFLFWLSYAVARELPAGRSMLADFSARLEDILSGTPAFRWKSAFDPRFGVHVFSGRGGGVRALTVHAFRLADPVTYAISDIEERVGRSDEYRGKVAFVSGAARGFGAVLARAFALRGATVALNYRHAEAPAARIGAEIEAHGGRVLFLKGDAEDPADCRRMREILEREAGGLDVLVHNAFPRVETAPLAELPESTIRETISRSVAVTYHLSRELLPLMREGGVVVDVSTSFLRETEPNFCHYVAAKAAQEGLLLGLSGERRDVRFLVVRVPRMRTDRTSAPGDFRPAASAIDVARDVLFSLAGPPGKGNFSVLEL